MYKEPIKELDTKNYSKILIQAKKDRIVPGEGFHCSNYKYQLLAINFHSTTNYNIYKTSTTTTRLQQHNSREEHASYPPEVPVPWRWSDLLGMQLHYAVEAVHELAHLDGKRRTEEHTRAVVSTCSMALVGLTG